MIGSRANLEGLLDDIATHTCTHPHSCCLVGALRAMRPDFAEPDADLAVYAEARKADLAVADEANATIPDAVSEKEDIDG